MIDKFAAASCRELETLLKSLFESAATTPVRCSPGTFFGREPILGHLVITGEDHSDLRLSIYKALCAREKSARRGRIGRICRCIQKRSRRCSMTMTSDAMSRGCSPARCAARTTTLITRALPRSSAG